MKAAILEKINEPLVLGDVELTDLQIGQVLVRVLVSGLCGAQLQEIRGEKGNAKFVPHLLGHEGCGIVEATGPGVTRVKKGDKVILHWRKGEGIESPFPTYVYKGKPFSSGKVTTLSEYTIASENRLTPVSHDTPDELCALLGCGLSTALGTINNDAKIKFGETVLIIGCGGVGINLIQGASLAGAGDIYAVDISEEKRALVEKFNAIYFNIDNNNFNLLDSIKNIDCIIDTTGHMDLITAVLPNLSERGRIIIISQPKLNSSITFTKPSNFFLGEGQTISSTQGGKINPSTDFSRFIKLYQSGKLNISNLITHTLSLDEINIAVELLKAGKAGRILIKIS
jgi:S-(hydroxymethyl)glutathione dehydrogenase / alcohol dehydrogenase